MAPPLVLHVITRWLRGGAEQKTLAELQGLRGRYRYELVHGGSFEPEMRARVEALGVPVTMAPRLRHYNPITAPVAVRSLQRLLEERRPDVLHVHSTEAGIVGRMAARGLGIPVVYTLHGLPFGAGRSLPLRWLVRAMERRMAPHTARFLANSAAIRDAYLAAGIGAPEQRVTNLQRRAPRCPRRRAARAPSRRASLPPRAVPARRSAGRGAAAGGASRYGFIVSRSVFEHLYDALGALASMAACLRPGGVMVHKVDLRDHGMFTPEFDELAWLRVPSALYRRGVRNAGRPNRVLFHPLPRRARRMGPRGAPCRGAPHAPPRRGRLGAAPAAARGASRGLAHCRGVAGAAARTPRARVPQRSRARPGCGWHVHRRGEADLR